MKLIHSSFRRRKLIFNSKARHENRETSPTRFMDNPTSEGNMILLLQKGTWYLIVRSIAKWIQHLECTESFPKETYTKHPLYNTHLDTGVNPFLLHLLRIRPNKLQQPCYQEHQLPLQASVTCRSKDGDKMGRCDVWGKNLKPLSLQL